MELNRTSFTRTFADCVNSVDSGSLLKRRLSSRRGRPSRINESGTVPQRSETSEIQLKFLGLTDVGVRSSSSLCSGTDITIASDVHPPESADKVCSGRVAIRTKRSRQRLIRSRSGNEVETTPDECEPKAPRCSRGPELIAGAKTRKPSLQVKNACTRCRHRKAKCSGTRPSCKHCMKRGLACSYDVAEGSTRSNDLKRKLQESSNRAHYFGCILAALRDGTDFQASQILARLRLGDPISDVVRTLPIAFSSPQDEPELAALDLCAPVQ